MNARVLPASDRRYPRARDADTIAHYFAAPLREKPDGRRDGAATYRKPDPMSAADNIQATPEWGDFESSLEEESFWRLHA